MSVIIAAGTVRRGFPGMRQKDTARHALGTFGGEERTGTGAVRRAREALDDGSCMKEVRGGRVCYTGSGLRTG